MNSEGKLIKNKQILYCVKILGGIILGCLFLIPIYMLFVSSIKPTTDVFDLRFIPKIISFASNIPTEIQGEDSSKNESI